MVDKRQNKDVAKYKISGSVAQGAWVGGMVGVVFWVWVDFVLVAPVVVCLIIGNLSYFVGFFNLESSQMLQYIFTAPFRKLPIIYFPLLPSFILLGVAIGSLFTFLMNKLRLDVEKKSLSALRWAVKTMFSWTYVVLWVPFEIFIIGYYLFLGPGDNLWFAMAFVLFVIMLLLFILPLFVCRAELAALPAGQIFRSSPKWPGWKAVGVFVALWLISIFVYLFMPLVTLFQTAVLLSRSHRSLFSLDKILRWRLLNPWLSYHLYFALTGFVALIFFIPVSLFFVECLPPINAFYFECGLKTPLFWRILDAVSYSLDTSGWILLLSVPATILYWLGAARLGWSLGLHEPEKID